MSPEVVLWNSAFLRKIKLVPETSPTVESITFAALSLIQSTDKSISSKPWLSLCQQEAARYLLQSSSPENPISKDIMLSLASSRCYEVRLAVLEHIANLQHPPDYIFEYLSDQLIDGEGDYECLTHIYTILSQFIEFQQNQNYMKNAGHLISLLEQVIFRLGVEACTDMITAMLQLSSSVVAALLSLVRKKCSSYITTKTPFLLIYNVSH